MYMTAQRNSAVTNAVADIGINRAILAEKTKQIQVALDQGGKLAQDMVSVIGHTQELVEQASNVGDEQAKATNELANSIEEIASIADEMQVN
jgi:methyl-accepting chemotaxis protein